MKGLTIGFASLLLGVLMLLAPRPAQAQEYPRDAQKPQAKSSAGEQAPRAFDAVCNEGDRCAIKVCDGGACQVSLFDGAEFRPIARVEDIDAVIDDAAGKLRRKR